jgi:hypothetical protein
MIRALQWLLSNRPPETSSSCSSLMTSGFCERVMGCEFKQMACQPLHLICNVLMTSIL